MSINSLTSKIATPYAKALFDFSIQNSILHIIAADCRNLEVFLDEYVEIKNYLNNPIIRTEDKEKILLAILGEELNVETLKFLIILIKRNRINLLNTIIDIYFEFVYQVASIKIVEVQTAVTFTSLQRDNLVKKLKILTNAREIYLTILINPDLLGGFQIRIGSDLIDFTYQNYLLKLSKHLNVNIEI